MVESWDLDSQDFMVIWVDSDVYKGNYCVEQKARLHSKVKSLKAFDSHNECIDYIGNHQDTSIFILVSGILCTSEFKEKVGEFMNVEIFYSTEDTKKGFEEEPGYMSCRSKFMRSERKRIRFQGIRCYASAIDINEILHSLIEDVGNYTLHINSPYPTRLCANLSKECYGEKNFLNLIVIWLDADILKKNIVAVSHSSLLDEQKLTQHSNSYSNGLDMGYNFTEIKTRLLDIVDNIMVFDDIDQCVKYITDLAINTDIHFIVSGQYRQYISLFIHHLSVSSHIYSLGQWSFDEVEKYKSLLQKNKSCLTGFFPGIDGLIDSLKRNLDTEWKKLTSEKVNARYTKENSYQNAVSWLKDRDLSLPYLCLMDCLPLLPINASAKNDLILDAQKHYKDDSIELHKISEFENSYCEEQAIWWYTRDSFIYRLINKVLRTQDINIIFTYRLFLVNLCTQLKKLHNSFRNNNSNLVITFYRGQRLQPIEIYKFQKNIGGFTITNTFLSASANRDIACIYAGNGIDSPFIESILLEITVDISIKTTKPYALIQQFSYYQAENEILFSLGTRFKIISVEQNLTNRIWTVNLLLVNNFKEDEDVQDYFSANKISNIQGCNIYLALGHVLSNNMHQKKQAKRFYQMVIDEFPSSHSDVTRAYMRLGLLHRPVRPYRNNDTDDNRQISLNYFEKALEIFYTVGKGTLFDIVDLYLNISQCHIEMKNNLQLILQYLQKTHHILMQYIALKSDLNIVELFGRVTEIFKQIGNERKSSHYIDLSNRFRPMFHCTNTLNDHKSDLFNVLTILKTKLEVSSSLSIDDYQLINDDLENVVECVKIYEQTINDLERTAFGIGLTDDDGIDLDLHFHPDKHHVLKFSDGTKAFINKIFPITVNSSTLITIHLNKTERIHQ